MIWVVVGWFLVSAVVAFGVGPFLRRAEVLAEQPERAPRRRSDAA